LAKKIPSPTKVKNINPPKALESAMTLTSALAGDDDGDGDGDGDAVGKEDAACDVRAIDVDMVAGCVVVDDADTLLDVTVLVLGRSNESKKTMVSVEDGWAVVVEREASCFSHTLGPLHPYPGGQHAFPHFSRSSTELSRCI
jgi:hypothetical protein